MKPISLVPTQKVTPSDLGTQMSFKDGTKYMRMPNGELRRMSPRAFQIRKNAKK
jgi:hypothetical protein